MQNIWLIGASNMAIDYYQVLDALKVHVTVIGRGSEKAATFKSKTGKDVVTGGLSKYLATKPDLPSHAIIAVGAENLYNTAVELLNYGVKQVLIEKPGALKREHFEHLQVLKTEKSASVFIAYNRRHYASVIAAKEIIKNDGGVTSFNFEFTEWSHVIEPLVKAEGVKESWFIANSTHVVDMAFFMGGSPKQIASFSDGKLSWHPKSNFAGAGVSETGALFNYQANWESAGRWAVEIMTKNHRLIFKPLEKLQIQKKGTIAENFAELNYDLDEKFKPGLYLQTKNFLDGEFNNLCNIDEQVTNLDIYMQMVNGNV